MSNQGATYAVDIVMCIDGKGSMTLIEEIKSSALKFYDQLEAKMARVGKKIDQLRVKVIVFRHYWADSQEKVMVSSPFFHLPSQSSEFANFVSKIEADGGGDEPENGLEALGLALKSDWIKGDFTKQRYVTILFTDASAHSLEKGEKPSYYPTNISKTLNDLSDFWEQIPVSAKRLVLFAPDAEPWTVIGNSWNNTVYYTSKAGQGLDEIEMDQILDVCSVYSI